jgi:exosome complex exonuclease DIS3/RRP44
VDGDIVAIELFGVDQWLSSVDTSKEEESKKKDEAGIATDTAEPSVKDMDNVEEELVDDSGALRRPTGHVVGIIRRNFHKNYCGSIWSVDNASMDDNEKHPNDFIVAKHETEHADGITSTVVFFSIDPRVPPVLIRTTQRERLLGMRILVSMDSWPSDSAYPLGHYVKTLGVAGTKDTETEVLLQEFRIPCEPFPAKVSIDVACFCLVELRSINSLVHWLMSCYLCFSVVHRYWHVFLLQTTK